MAGALPFGKNFKLMERLSRSYDFGALAATATIKLRKVYGDFALDDVVINIPAGIVADVNNYFRFEIKKGDGTVMASWSTQTVGGGGNGSLAADTPTRLVLAALKDNKRALADDVLSFVATKVGTGAVPAGANFIDLQGRYRNTPTPL
jgi:hypothetical protein